VKMEIPWEWIENVISKTEYFDIIKQHFVCGYKRSKILRDDCNLYISLNIGSMM
jgi:hypothetical protein